MAGAGNGSGYSWLWVVVRIRVERAKEPEAPGTLEKACWGHPRKAPTLLLLHLPDQDHPWWFWSSFFFYFFLFSFIFLKFRLLCGALREQVLWRGENGLFWATFYNSELVEILVEIQNTSSSIYQFGDRQGMLLSHLGNSEKKGKKKKVLHESFLAEGLNLDGVVRVLSLRFMGIYLSWRWIREFCLEMLPRGDLHQRAYAKWTLISQNSHMTAGLRFPSNVGHSCN